MNVAHDSSTRVGGTHASDFIWALRFAKIDGGKLRRRWKVDTYTSSKATFSDEVHDDDIAESVAGEGITDFKVVKEEESDFALVVLGEDEPN